MSGGGKGGGYPTTEELAAFLIAREFPLSAWDDFTIGMLLNYIYAYDRMQKRIHGQHVSDPEEQYRQLKSMEDQVERMYREGKIKKYKYESYKQSLARWEEAAD